MKKLILNMTTPNNKTLIKTINVSNPIFNLLIATEQTYEPYFDDDENFFDRLFDIQYEIVRTFIDERLGLEMGFIVQDTLDMTNDSITLAIELIER